MPAGVSKFLTNSAVRVLFHQLVEDGGCARKVALLDKRCRFVPSLGYRLRSLLPGPFFALRFLLGFLFSASLRLPPLPCNFGRSNFTVLPDLSAVRVLLDQLVEDGGCSKEIGR